MKKTLKDYTPEIRAKVAEYKKLAVNDLYNGTEAANWKREDTVNYIEYVYNMVNRKKPVVIIANSPQQYKQYFNALFQENSPLTETINQTWAKKNGTPVSDVKLPTEEIKIDKSTATSNHYLFIVSEYARVYLMWYKFIMDEFKISCTKEKDLNWLYENVNKANIAKAYFCERVVLVLRMPTKILRNEVGFHCITNDGAIQYTNEKYHYLNGRSVPNWVFDKYFSGTLTFEDFTKETNEDVKGNIITLIKENEGSEGILKFLNAELVDEQSLVHSSGHLETVKLYKTKENYSFLQDKDGNTNVPYAWTEFICPSTGQTYLIDTCPSFTNALDSMKFHRPNGVPESIVYDFTEFNN